MNNADPPLVLQYNSNRPAYPLACGLLQVWSTLSFVAAPLGLVAAVGGTIGFWFHLSQVDSRSADMARIGFVLWCPLAAVLAFVPIVWSVLCARCRTRLAMGDTSGAVMACRLCRWAAGGGILLVAGLVFGVWNAWRTDHPKELPIWAIAFLVLAGVGAGNAYTYVVMRRIVRDVKAGNPARPAA